MDAPLFNFLNMPPHTITASTPPLAKLISYSNFTSSNNSGKFNSCYDSWDTLLCSIFIHQMASPCGFICLALNASLTDSTTNPWPKPRRLASMSLKIKTSQTERLKREQGQRKIGLMNKAVNIQCESKKSPPPKGPDIFHFFHKRLRICNRFFTHLLNVTIFARLQIFIQLSPILTKLCYIKRDCPVHLICAKCLKRAKTRAFRRLRKSLIALLIVVCGK